MKKYILLALFSLSILHGDNQISCLHVNDNNVKIIIKSEKLNLTEDAIVDNTGGYVDIPQERYYIKSDSNLYKLKGKVVTTLIPEIKQFQANLSTDEFQQLQTENNLLLIQKIELSVYNQSIKKQNTLTTNTITINFPSNLNQKEHKCSKR